MSGSAAARPSPFEVAQRKFPRVEAAFVSHRADVERVFREAGAAWPPSGLFLRSYKLEGRLELWAKVRGGDTLVEVRRFAVCAKSGVLGPKAVSGDLQVPEGVYRVDRFNPRSRYHLSLGLDYPNAVDLARADGRPPGGDIFIHGDCVTIGCLPLEDGPIEWLYVAAVLARGRAADLAHVIDVHIFPCRFGTGACEEELATHSAELQSFWDTLRPIHAAFEVDKRPPRVTIDSRGYRLRGP
jgi:murein L,D-transpeptidase YafK